MGTEIDAEIDAEIETETLTLSIDIGGSGIKGALLNSAGEMISERVRISTPYPCPPQVLVQAVRDLAANFSNFTRLSVGFPGLVREGRVSFVPALSRAELNGAADPNLVAAWQNFELGRTLSETFKLPVRVANDADMQGSAVIKGHGLEFVMTLGTGCGTALFYEGKLLPHLELGHAPFRNGESFEEQLGNAARKDIGKSRWIKRVQQAIATYESFLFFDHIYIGGGNARRLTGVDLGSNVTLVDNSAGILGGIRIWDH